VVGVFKAYTTRVGNGPYPTELTGELGEQIRQAGGEFGSTTGRPRRTGWLDLPALDYACLINGVTELAITKVDVLSGMDEVQVCNAYENKGEQITTADGTESAESITPVYDTLPGWQTDGSGEDAALERYLKLIEKRVNVPVKHVSFGPGREQLVAR
ncbi:MAG: adenylosuccinate synthetase, partial [Bacteroidota bacterium]